MPHVNPAAIVTAAKKKRRAQTADADPSQPKVQSVRQRRYGYLAETLRQKQVRDAYENPTVQWCIAGLIMGNFMTNIVEKQIDPWNLNYPDQWRIVEAAWNGVFIIELAWNMYGSWYCTTLKGHFLCSGWNIFDFIVVAVSVPSLTGADLGSFSQMRMLRAFRVFRLFKRIKSLNKIIVALGNAVPGIVNAAIVQCLVMCIYAILAVDLFGDFGARRPLRPATPSTPRRQPPRSLTAPPTLRPPPLSPCIHAPDPLSLPSATGEEGTYINIDNDTIPMITMRGMTYGDEYFGTFLRSLYTLFQVRLPACEARAYPRAPCTRASTRPRCDAFPHPPLRRPTIECRFLSLVSSLSSLPSRLFPLVSSLSSPPSRFFPLVSSLSLRPLSSPPSRWFERMLSHSLSVRAAGCCPHFHPMRRC